MSNSSCSIAPGPGRAAGGDDALVADALQALGHGLGVDALVVDDQDAEPVLGGLDGGGVGLHGTARSPLAASRPQGPRPFYRPRRPLDMRAANPSGRRGVKVGKTGPTVKSGGVGHRWETGMKSRAPRSEYRE